MQELAAFVASRIISTVTILPPSADPSGSLMSEKLDGWRADFDGHRLTSRNGADYCAPEWFLAGLPSVPLVGELWAGRVGFERVQSAIRGDWRGITFNVFENPTGAHVETPHAREVEQLHCLSRSHLQQFFDGIIAGGGEGVVGRSGGEAWKIKPLADAEACIIGHKPGRGKYAGKLGSYIVTAINGEADGSTVKLGGMSDAEQTPSLPDARPHSDRFRCGGRESKFLAAKALCITLWHNNAVRVMRVGLACGSESPAQTSRMKLFSLRVLASVFCAGFAVFGGFVGRAEDMRTLEGQVFIRTKGGASIKLSLVPVQLFEEATILPRIEESREVSEAVREVFTPLVKEAQRKAEAMKGADPRVRLRALENVREILFVMGYTRSVAYCFKELPRPLQTTKTDADGKFSFKVPKGSYVLAALSERMGGGEREYYGWLVRAKVTGDTTIMLANDNLSSSESPESLITTIDEEGTLPAAMKSKHFPAMMAVVEKTKRERAQKIALVERNKREHAVARDAQAAQLKAIELYPELAVAGSPLNKEFVERVKRYQTEKKEFFTEPDWPIRLAKECSEDLRAKPVAK